MTRGTTGSVCRREKDLNVNTYPPRRNWNAEVWPTRTIKRGVHCLRPLGQTLAAEARDRDFYGSGKKRGNRFYRCSFNERKKQLKMSLWSRPTLPKPLGFLKGDIRLYFPSSLRLRREADLSV